MITRRQSSNTRDDLAGCAAGEVGPVGTKLDLVPSDHVVESAPVGAARRARGLDYGCRVTTTTISDAQFRYASKRVADAGWVTG